MLLDDGTDVTDHFLRGADEVVRAARDLRLKRIYLKAGSPSCGVGLIYIKGRLSSGNGVCAAALLREGVELIAV